MKPVTRYADERELRELRRDAVVTFSFNKKLRTIRLPGNEYVKVRFCQDDELDLLRSLARKFGVKGEYNPSSYASLWHDAAPIPKSMTTSALKLLPDTVVGAWQEARVRAHGLTDLREYDLVSAYGWAAMRPIPCHRSLWPTTRYVGPGVYLCKILRRSKSVLTPPHLRYNSRKPDALYWLTSEEIEELDLTVDVVRGVIFSKWWRPRDRVEKLLELAPRPVAKKILRSYWGAYASTLPVECWSKAKDSTWMLPNRLYDPLAAIYIVSRVRNRIAQVAKDALHIYCDAVITPARLEVGTELGAWSIKNRFEKLSIVGPGRWLDRTSGAAKHAGTKDAQAV